jgi:hypothetical protein
MDVFFRIGSLHVNVVYETRPGKWLLGWRLYNLFFRLPQKCHLKKSGYNNASINHCFSKASGIDRKDLIQYKEKNSNNRSECHLSSHVKCFVWQLCGNRYRCSSVGLLYMSNTIFTGIVSIQMLVLDVLWVNFIVRWTLLAWSKKQWRFSFESVHFMSMSCMKRDQESGFWGEDCIIIIH